MSRGGVIVLRMEVGGRIISYGVVGILDDVLGVERWEKEMCLERVVRDEFSESKDRMLWINGRVGGRKEVQQQYVMR